jgi:transcriptional regulator with XRE-family HTH domain
MQEDPILNLLKQLGQRLKQARLEREDSQKDFAFRVGVSIPTLQKMESGSPQVAIGTWVKALDILGRVQELDSLIAPKKSLAERFEIQQKAAGRQRVKRNR